MVRRIHGLGLLFLAISFATASARAQCLQWQPGFEPAGVGGGSISQLEVFDDGSGARLYALGSFGTAGTVRANHIAAWNGSTWSPLGAGVGLPAYSPSAMASFDDGSGMALYVGEVHSTPGFLNHFAKWDGSTWSELLDPAIVNGLLYVRDLAVFDEGNGPVLFAAGQFGLGEPLGVQAIRRWDGNAWSVVGAGITGYVNELIVFDDGTGPALYAAGNFTGAGGPSGHRIAKWDGVVWSPLAGFDGEINELTAIDAGHPGGPELIAGGAFSNAGGTAASRIAKWDGSTWSELGTGIGIVSPSGSSSLESLTYYDSGSGLELYAGGSFTGAGGSSARNLARWNGVSWSAVGNNPNDSVRELRVFDDGLGGGPALYATGFTVVGTTVVHDIARWNGSTWSALGSSNGVVGRVRATLKFDDGNGEALFVAGAITAAGNIPVNGIARWDGANWSNMDGGVSVVVPFPPSSATGEVRALAVFDDGTGDALYAGGSFSHAGGTQARYVAKWNGVSWSSIGSPFDTQANALAVFDDGSGPALYVGGFFPSHGHIARWNGSVWQPVGGLNSGVGAMKVFHDSFGPQLYVGGSFNQAGGAPAVGIAKWNGSWSPVGIGTAGNVSALEVYSGGTGVPSLYVGGGFQFAGGISVNQIARWNGSAWSPVGSGLGEYGAVSVLRVGDDGTGNGQVLYAGGYFDVENGAPANRLAKWNGTSWSAAGGGIDPDVGYAVHAIESFDADGDGRADLFVGGEFAATAGGNAENLAQWRHCAGPGTPFCFGDGSAGDCPCTPPNVVPIPSGSNFGGCANSFNPHGGGISATGNIQPTDTVTLIASGISPVGFCQFFKTDSTAMPGIGVLDGISCASGNLIRFGNQNAAGGFAKYPNPPLGLVIPVSVRGATPVGSGLTGHYQVVYRNTKLGFCTPDTLNFSSSYRITWN